MFPFNKYVIVFISVLLLMQVTNNIIYECLYLEHKMNLECLFWLFLKNFPT